MKIIGYYERTRIYYSKIYHSILNLFLFIYQLYILVFMLGKYLNVRKKKKRDYILFVYKNL